jgi:SAM-dependent methyltransferase
MSHTTISVLDIGGGNGEMCEAAIRADPRVVSTTIVDLDSSLESYHKTTVHSYICSKIEDFHPDTTFDVAMMINLIEHVEDPRRLLIDVRKLLSPGGLLILQTPNIDSLDARLFRNSHWGGLHAPRHWVLFDRVNLERILKESGFIDVQIRYSQGAPFWAVSAIYWLQRIGLLTPGSRLVHERRLYKQFLFIFAVLDVVRAQFGFRTSQMYVAARVSN